MRILIILFLAIFTFPAFSGVSVSFFGEITPGSLSRLGQRIEKVALKFKSDEERVVILDLDSGGGNLYATLDFIDAIREKMRKLNLSLHTRVRNSCESSCTILYTAGEKRIAGRRARFGFHSPNVVSRLPRGIRREDIIDEAREKWLIALSKVDPSLSVEVESRALLLDDEMTYLQGKELLTGYVTELIR